MLAKRLKQLRIQSNLTQKQLAEKMNIASSTISMYEAGRRDPDTETLLNFSKVFNVSVDYLLGNEFKAVRQEHLTNVNNQIKGELGEDVSVMLKDINQWDEEKVRKLKNLYELIKSGKL